MNMLYCGSHYLVTLDEKFVAPDNYEYKAVFGESHDEIDLDNIPEKITYLQIGQMNLPIRDIKSIIRTSELTAEEPRLNALRLIYRA